MLTCRKCPEPKAETDFHWRDQARGVRHTICKVCQLRLRRAHYQQNKTYYKDAAKEQRRKQAVILKQFLVEAKSKPCTDCKVQYPPWVMQFDHLPGHKKELAISQAPSNGWSIERVVAEIAKTEVVCANCHMQRTHDRRALSRP